MKILKRIPINIKLKDNRTSYPETFKEDLNYQCGRILTFASIITLSWLTYIPIDLQLHPDKPVIIALRIGFPVVGLLIFLSRFIRSLRERNLLMLTIYGAYMSISNAVLAGSTVGDAAYIGGYLFILTLLAVAPLQKMYANLILVMSDIAFFGTCYLSGIRSLTPQNRYSLNDVICVSFIVSCFIHILNNTRYVNWFKSRQVEIGEEGLKIQKIYSESLEQTVYERTKELEVERNNLQIRNEIMENDLKMAKKIHEQLMPIENPASFIYSLYKPMDMVGGDFFDFIKFRDSNRLGIFISDVSGHGLPAAFITSMIKTIILQAGEKKLYPAELLSYINEVLYDQIGGNFVTAFYGIYDTSTRTFVFSNAGHNPPLVITDNAVSELKGHKTVPIGITKNSYLKTNNKEFKNSEVIFTSESKLLLFTDGFTECQPFNNVGLSFEESNINELILQNKNLPCDLFIKNLYNSLIDFRGNESFEDDVCLICLDVI